MRFERMEAVKKLMNGLNYKTKGQVFMLSWKTTN